MKKNLTTLILLVVSCQLAVASGFQVKLQGHRQSGMGNAGVALRPDASSIFFNPGAMSMMEGNQIAFGASGVMARNSYYNPETGEAAVTEEGVGTPFYLYGTFGPEDSKFKFGMGIYTPYGNTLSWGEEWAGKFQLREISLSAIFFQPTVSYKLSDKLGIGAGFIYAIGGINLQRAVGLPLDFGSTPNIELDGSASGMGFNLGLYFEPSEKFSIGVNYRSEVEVEVEGGDVTVTNIPNDPLVQSLLPASTTFDAALPLPANLAIGVAFRPNDRLTLTAEGTNTFWSAYEELRFDFAAPVGGDLVSASPRNYENTWVVNFGAEYKISDVFAARGGFYFDQTPVPDGIMTAETADQDRLGLTAGLGIKPSEKFSIDLYFLYIDGEEREQTYADAVSAGTIDPNESSKADWGVLPGRYHLNAVIPGIAVSYNF